MPAKKKQPTYEELKDKLDEAVSRLSDDKLTLSEMMTLYEEGTRYAAECQSILEGYRVKIEAMSAPENNEADENKEEE